MPWMGIQDLWTFLLAVLVFLALPGPGTFTLLTATGRGGVRGGYTALAGLLVGDQILMWLALAGVDALLKANPTVFHAVKYLGAAYLIYLGVRKLTASEDAVETVGFKRESLARIYWQGLAINILNPKTAFFFLAFLPQFVDPARGNVTAQTLLLGAIFVGMAIITDSLYALLASSLAGRLAGNRGFQKGQRYFAGLVYVGLGITTALTGSRK